MQTPNPILFIDEANDSQSAFFELSLCGPVCKGYKQAVPLSSVTLVGTSKQARPGLLKLATNGLGSFFEKQIRSGTSVPFF